MDLNKQNIDSTAVGIAEVQLVYIENTLKRIEEDLLFFLDKSRDNNITEKENICYARVAILLMPFYLESFSNLLYDAIVGKPLNRGKLPKPLLRFQAVHYQIYGTELPLSTDGIQDIFTIRNKIMVHPSGFSKERHSEDPSGDLARKREDRNIRYLKFTDLPFVYSRFKPSHAKSIVIEVMGFLTEFLGLLKGKVSQKEILDECWPTKLIEWSKTNQNIE